MGDNGELVAGSIEAQTRQTLKNVEKALFLAGCTLKDVVKSTVWLDDARVMPRPFPISSNSSCRRISAG